MNCVLRNGILLNGNEERIPENAATISGNAGLPTGPYICSIPVVH